MLSLTQLGFSEPKTLLKRSQIFLAVAAAIAVLPSISWADDASNTTANDDNSKIEIVPSDNSQANTAQNQTPPAQIHIENETKVQNPPQQAGTADNQTVSNEDVRVPMTLRNEVLAIRPNAGAMVFHDVAGDQTTRAIYGLTLDWNFTGLVTNNPMAYVGISTGGLFSHLGSATSDFWGSSPTTVENSPGANMILIPADLKLGFNMGDAVRLSARGGGNLIYRSEGVAMDLGSSTATSSNIWRIYPNVGADVDFGLARGITLGLRPDYTFTPGQNIFVGTVALGISMG